MPQKPLPSSLDISDLRMETIRRQHICRLHITDGSSESASAQLGAWTPHHFAHQLEDFAKHLICRAAHRAIEP